MAWQEWKGMLAMGIAMATLGCGARGPEIAHVEGVVTLDGQPLANAAVVFVPENGRPAGATTDAAGKYVLTFTKGRRGAIPGKNKVLVRTARDPSETPEGQPIPGSPETIPARYNAQTELEFTVEPGKTNVANFDLVSGGAVAEQDDYQ